MGLPVKELIVRVAYRTDQASQRRAQGGIRSLARGLGGLAAAAGTVFAGFSAVSFVRQMIQVGDEVGKTSKQLGIAVENLQALQFAADRSGVDTNAFNQSIIRLQKNLFEAQRGSALYVEALDRLNVSATTSDGSLRDVSDILPELADAFKGLESNTERTALATTLFGRTGARLLPLLDEGASGIDALTLRFAELGGGLSSDFTGQAEKAQDALTDFNVVATVLRSKIALAIIPAVTDFLVRVTNLASEFFKLDSAMTIIKIGLVGLTSILGVVAIAWIVAFAKPILIVAAIAAAVTALVLIIDDLIVTFQGGDSVIRRFIDGLFGIGTTERVVSLLKEAWEGFILVIQDTWTAIQMLEPIVVAVANQVVKNIQLMQTMFAALWGVIQSGAQAAANVLRNVFGVEINSIIGALNRVLSVAASVQRALSFGGVLDALGNLTGRFGDQARTNQRGLAASRGAGASGNVNVSNGGTTINVNGAGNPAAVANQVTRQMRREQDRQNRQAFAALQQRAPA